MFPIEGQAQARANANEDAQYLTFYSYYRKINRAYLIMWLICLSVAIVGFASIFKYILYNNKSTGIIYDRQKFNQTGCLAQQCLYIGVKQKTCVLFDYKMKYGNNEKTVLLYEPYILPSGYTYADYVCVDYDHYGAEMWYYMGKYFLIGGGCAILLIPLAARFSYEQAWILAETVHKDLFFMDNICNAHSKTC
jgi:hypothetical protein